MEFHIIKRTLNSFCYSDYLKHQIQEIVLNVNKIAFEAYNLANLYLLLQLEKNKPIYSLNQTFFRNCCTLVSSLRERKALPCKYEELEEAYQLYQKERPFGYTVPPRDSIGQVIDYLSLEMETCVKNHLLVNFGKRVAKYLKRKYNVLKPHPIIWGVEKKGYERSEYEGEDVLVLKIRKEIGDQTPDECLHSNPTLLLKFYWKIQKYFEKSGIRSFSLLPHKRTFHLSYVSIDNKVLLELLASPLEKKEKSQFKKDWKANSSYYWSSNFDLPSNFHYFTTDGYSVSILCKKKGVTKTRKKKKAPLLEEYHAEDYERVVGIDPGHRNVLAGISGDYEEFSLSSREYYHNIGTNRLRTKQQEWIDEQHQKFIAHMPSNKVSTSKELLTYIHYSLQGLEHALLLHFDKPFRKWRFRSYIKKQKEMMRIVNLITEGKKTLVGYGNWSNNPNSPVKGHRRGPVLKIKRMISRFAKVIDVDEYRTSQTCCDCFGENEKMRIRGKRVHSVLRCKNVICRTIKDRDLNASRNILLLTMTEGDRPSVFCR